MILHFWGISFVRKNCERRTRMLWLGFTEVHFALWVKIERFNVIFHNSSHGKKCCVITVRKKIRLFQSFAAKKGAISSKVIKWRGIPLQKCIRKFVDISKLEKMVQKT